MDDPSDPVPPKSTVLWLTMFCALKLPPTHWVSFPVYMGTFGSAGAPAFKLAFPVAGSIVTLVGGYSVIVT
jgi:hypothetical protein